MTGHQAYWTVSSALYQLRWEPSEHRASAVEYLTSLIIDGAAPDLQEIATGLLELYGTDGWATSESVIDDQRWQTSAEQLAQQLAIERRQRFRLIRALAQIHRECIPGTTAHDTASAALGQLIHETTPATVCAVCDGPLEVSALGPDIGLIHVTDADDTHVPVQQEAPARTDRSETPASTRKTDLAALRHEVDIKLAQVSNAVARERLFADMLANQKETP